MFLLLQTAELKKLPNEEFLSLIRLISIFWVSATVPEESPPSLTDNYSMVPSRQIWYNQGGRKAPKQHQDSLDMRKINFVLGSHYWWGHIF